MSLRIYGNRQIKTLPGQATRPTPSRVREALFNIWQGDIEGCRWLDLCTGTGAMGAEALCRGSAFVVGIEQAGRACSIIQQNWQQVAQAGQTFRVIRGSVVARLPGLAGQQFDRIYFDPPYASDLYEPVLQLIAFHHLLASEGELATEHSPDRVMPEEIFAPREAGASNQVDQSGWNQAVLNGQLGLKICRQKIYGNTALTFYQIGSNAAVRAQHPD